MIKQCVICGKDFKVSNSRAHIKTCSYECRRELNRRVVLQWREEKRKTKAATATCSICGKTFKPNFPNEHFCSDECRFSSPLYSVLARLYSSMGVIP